MDVRRSRGELLFDAALAAFAGARFFAAAFPYTHGAWPIPLDDTYIHFDFARAWAGGHPFSWIAGQGYSSGETAPLYAMVLAAGHLAGFGGARLGPFSAFIAWASMTSLFGSMRALVPRPRWAAPAGALVLAASGWLGFVWWSGMEVALLGAVLGRALVCVLQASRARLAPGTNRPRAALRAGAWLALATWLRPEIAVLVGCVAVLVGRAAKDRSALSLIARVALPPGLATGAILLLNRVFTGTFASAGAELKLLSSNPFLTDVDRARELVTNLVSFKWRIVDLDLATPRGTLLLWVGLGVVALSARRTRGLASACLAAAAAYGLLVSWNGAARYQNFRYYAPAFVLILVTVLLGASELGRRASRSVRVCAAIAMGAIAISAIAASGAQVRLFRQASRNVAEQQVEVGRRLARMLPRDAIVMIGDAGAIPFVSGLRAIDALGLGGGSADGAPRFAAAAPHGEAATLELVERLPLAGRPTHFALYPNWFPETTARFGAEIDRVTIEGNVICGGPTKAIYRADLSALRAPGAPPPDFRELVPHGVLVDEVDVADVVSERAHEYVHPAPNGGHTTLDVREGPEGRVFDAGRLLPEGASESFVPRADGDIVLVSRVDDATRGLEANGRLATLSPPRRGVWRHATLGLTVRRGEHIVVRGVGAITSHHHWIFIP